MKSIVLLVLAGLVIAAILFVPHHRREPDSFRPNTLAGIYRDLLTSTPERWNVERGTFLLIVLAGAFASAAPVVVATMLRWHRPAPGAAGGVAFAVVGVVAAIGAVANGALILLSQTTFAFGGRALPGDAVAFAWAVVIVQLTFAIASVAIAFSVRCAAIAS